MATRFRAIDAFDANRLVYLFGAGAMGCAVASYLRLCGRPATAFVDSHKDGEADGLPVLPLPCYMERRTARDLMIVTSSFVDEIGRSLIAHGIDDYVDASRFGGGLVSELRRYERLSAEPMLRLLR